MFKPTPEQFYNRGGQDRSKPDVAFLKNHFYREGRLTEEQALWILEKGTEVLRKEGNVLQVDAPITGMQQWRYRERLSNDQGLQFVETYMANMWVTRTLCNCLP